MEAPQPAVAAPPAAAPSAAPSTVLPAQPPTANGVAPTGKGVIVGPAGVPQHHHPHQQHPQPHNGHHAAAHHPHQQQQPQPRTLYVGNLDGKVTEDFLVAMFSPIGPLKACKIHHGHDNTAPGFAFVEYQTHDAAAAALVTMNKRTVLTKELKVNWANTNNQNNGHGHRGERGERGDRGDRVGGDHRGPGQHSNDHHQFNHAHHGSSNNTMHQSQGPHHPAKGPHVQAAKDTSQHHHIFVGDLSPEIETETLRTAFATYGEISDCRVVKDLTTQKSRGFGFVSFVQKADAQAAIEAMNGQWLGNRAIRTNWASRKPPGLYSNGGPRSGMNGHDGSNGKEFGMNSRHAPHPQTPLQFDEVFKQASPVNCTVYCGGLLNSDENVIRRTFGQFGRIVEVRYFKDKGYAFVRFDMKESACNAIVALHGQDVAGCQIKCSWGKENPSNGVAAPQPAASVATAAGYMSAQMQAAQQQVQQSSHLTAQVQNALAIAQAQAQQQQQQQPLFIQAPQSMDPAQQQQFYQQQQQQYAYCLYNPAIAAAAAAGFIPQMQYYGQPAMNMNPANAYANQQAAIAAAQAAAAQQQQQQPQTQQFQPPQQQQQQPPPAPQPAAAPPAPQQ